MKVTYSDSYDRAAGYAVSVTVTPDVLSVSMFYEAGSVPEAGDHSIVEGGSVHTAWEGRQMVPYSSLTLMLDEVRGTPSWSDRSVWTGCGRFLPDIMLPAAKHTKLWHNITAETFNSKVRPTNHFMRYMRSSPMDMGAFLMYVPFWSSDFDECALHILSHIEGIPHIVNGEPLSGPETDPMQAQRQAMPHLSLSGPKTIAPDGKVVLNVQLTDVSGAPLAKDCDVYFESVGGYLPQPRARITSGVGSVRVMALGLEKGETFKIKAGFRFWTGDTDHVLEVQ